MHEVTHISYGEGRVDVVLDSASQSSVAAPNFRFGDYTTLISSCFTQKELDRISEGENAEITFYFVVYDDVEDALLSSGYQEAISDGEAIYGRLNKGIFVDLSVKKGISDDAPETIAVGNKDVEIQMDIPLYMVRENRSYFFLADKGGEFDLLEDYTPDADVLTVKTRNFCPGLLMYQDKADSLISKEDKSFNLEVRHFLFAGIVVLVVLWFFIDHLHRNNQE